MTKLTVSLIAQSLRDRDLPEEINELLPPNIAIDAQIGTLERAVAREIGESQALDWQI